MGICVYWSCRHVVFVKRCNCSFYLTVAAAPGIIRHLRKLLAKIVGIKCASVFIGQLTVSGEA